MEIWFILELRPCSFLAGKVRGMSGRDVCVSKGNYTFETERKYLFGRILISKLSFYFLSSELSNVVKFLGRCALLGILHVK